MCQELYIPQGGLGRDGNPVENPLGSMVDIKLKEKEFHTNLTSIYYGPNPNENQYRIQSLYDDELPWGVMVDGSGSILIATNLDGRVIDLNNEASEKLTGDDLPEGLTVAQTHIGHHFTQYIDIEDRRKVAAKFQKVVQTGQTPDDFEDQITLNSNDSGFDADGQPIGAGYDMLVRLHLYPHFDKHGEPAGVIFEGEEVSERILEAHVANQVFKWDADMEGYNADKTELYTDDASDNYADDDFKTQQAKFKELYQNSQSDLRMFHGPMVSLNSSQKVEAITLAALSFLNPGAKYDDLVEEEACEEAIGKKFTKYLKDTKSQAFIDACKQVEKTNQPIIFDTQLMDGETVSSHKKFAIAPRYNAKAKSQGTIIGLMGSFISSFSLDSDGYVIDCSLSAATQLGYKSRTDVIGKDLIQSFVDQDSFVHATDMLSDFLHAPEMGELLGKDDTRVSRIEMIRRTKRVLQTTWEVFLQPTNNDKRVVIVIMHKERILESKARVEAQDQEAEDEMEKDLIEIIDLTPMKQMEPVPPPEDHVVVHLTPVERAQQQTEPIKYHFAVMQKEGDIEQEVAYEDFKKYVCAVKNADRPWEMHRVNRFQASALKKAWLAIYILNPDCNRSSMPELADQRLSFATWEIWWNKTEFRTGWDGGTTMTHISPPGEKDPFDYDKK